MSSQDDDQPSTHSDRLTLAQAAQVLGVHVNTLKNWRRSGELPSSQKFIERGVEVWYIDAAEAEQVFLKKRGLSGQSRPNVDPPTVDPPQPNEIPQQDTGAATVLMRLQEERESLLEKIWTLESQLQSAAFEQGQLASLQQQIERLEAGAGRSARLITLLVIALVIVALVALILLFFK